MFDGLPTKFDSIIDSRDVIEAIKFMETDDSEDWSEDLENLRELNRQGEEASEDWVYGVPLITDSHFTAYAEELAFDCGFINSVTWPMNHIDWESAAHELRYDYTPVEFDDVTYWVR